MSKSLIYSCLPVFRMAEIGVGKRIYSLRKRIQEIKSELDDMDDPISDIPELISSANLLRSNEYLSKSNQKKSELVDVYEQYCHHLEEVLSTIFEIQNDLKNILKEQSALISSSDSVSKRKSKIRRTSKK